MRLYLEHRKLYLQYREAVQKVENVLNDYEIISAKVQPKSSLAEHEREFSPVVVAAFGQSINKSEEYVIAWNINAPTQVRTNIIFFKLLYFIMNPQ